MFTKPHFRDHQQRNKVSSNNPRSTRMLLLLCGVVAVIMLLAASGSRFHHNRRGESSLGPPRRHTTQMRKNVSSDDLDVISVGEERGEGDEAPAAVSSSAPSFQKARVRAQHANNKEKGSAGGDASSSRRWDHERHAAKLDDESKFRSRSSSSSSNTKGEATTPKKTTVVHLRNDLEHIMRCTPPGFPRKTVGIDVYALDGLAGGIACPRSGPSKDNDIVCGTIRASHTWERAALGALIGSVRRLTERLPGVVFLDVGSNVGALAMPVAAVGASLVGRSSSQQDGMQKKKKLHVHAFEMLPLHASLMEVTRCLNELDDVVEVHNVALGSPAQVAGLNGAPCAMVQNDPKNPGNTQLICNDSSAVGGGTSGASSTHRKKGRRVVGTMPLKTLDEALLLNGGSRTGGLLSDTSTTTTSALLKQGWGTVMKIDVEGSELEVLEGAAGLFAMSPPRLVWSEVWRTLDLERLARLMLGRYRYAAAFVPSQRLWMKSVEDVVAFHKQMMIDDMDTVCWMTEDFREEFAEIVR